MPDMKWMEELDRLDTLEPRWKMFTCKGRRFILREPQHWAVARWRSVLAGGMEIGTDGRPKSVGSSYAEADAILIAACLKEVLSTDEDGTPTAERELTVEQVRSMYHRVLDPVWKWVRWAAGLDRDEEGRDETGQDGKAGTEGSAKNGHAATTGPSA